MDSGDIFIVALLMLCGVDGMLITKGRETSTSVALWLSTISASLPILSAAVIGFVIELVEGKCPPHRPFDDMLIGAFALFQMFAIVNVLLTPVYIIAVVLSLVRERWRRAAHFLLILSINLAWVIFLIRSWDESSACGSG